MKQHIKKMAEQHLIQFMKNKVKTLEENVAKTRKGVKNRFSSLLGLKTPERGENDGTKPGFRMNKSELELRNLIDTAFVFQDYDTTYQNAQFPLKDFKGCKAYRFAGSCLELQLLS